MKLRGQRGRFTTVSLQERFWKHVRKTSGCWIWMGYRNTHRFGYGVLYAPEFGTTRAHRVSWMLHFGRIESSVCVLHSCDTPACVKPAHLFLGSRADNIADAKSKGRMAAGVRHSQAKLTAEQVQFIRALRFDRSRREVVAKAFGVTERTIRRVANARTYRSL